MSITHPVAPAVAATTGGAVLLALIATATWPASGSALAWVVMGAAAGYALSGSP